MSETRLPDSDDAIAVIDIASANSKAYLQAVFAAWSNIRRGALVDLPDLGMGCTGRFVRRS